MSLLLVLSIPADAQQQNQDTLNRKYFIGSSAFVLANLVPDDNSPDFIQLNLGYRLTPKDALSLELKTWKYAWSLGIPYGDNFEAPSLMFPGYIREHGIALVYQRFLWKGLYSAIHVMSSRQKFVNDNGKKIDDGFQVFNTYRIGYQFNFWNNRFFIEPSIAITHRAFHTDMPQSFKVIDDDWSKFFFGEPGLHFGINF